MIDYQPDTIRGKSEKFFLLIVQTHKFEIMFYCYRYYALLSLDKSYFICCESFSGCR